MAYINLDSPLNIVLVSVCVLAVLYLIYRMFFSTPTTTPIITPQMTTAYNAAAVNQGLTAADVRSPQENFEATSGSNLNVFDTRQKLNQNFTYFLQTFAKMISIDNINKIISKDIQNKKTTDIEKEKNINFTEGYGEIFDDMLVYLYLMSNNTDKILLGLSIISLITIYCKETSKNATCYYLNDFNNVGEFNIYIVPNNYNGDISKLNKDNSIIEVELDFERTDYTKLSKIPLFKQIEKKIFNSIISNRATTSSIPLSTLSPEYIALKNEVNNKKDQYTSLIEYAFGSMYIYFNNPSALTVNSSIVKDITDLWNSPNMPTVFKQNVTQTTQMSLDMIRQWASILVA